jgi:hypothetical protein
MQRSRALGAMFFGIVVLVAGGGLSSWQHTVPVAARATAATGPAEKSGGRRIVICGSKRITEFSMPAAFLRKRSRDAT